MITTLWVWKMNKTQPFRQHHITRGLRAQLAAGVCDPSVQVCLPDGTRFVFGGSKPDAAFAEGGKGPANKMFGRQAASPQRGGQTGKSPASGKRAR
jgi:hypothetical protein